MINKKRDVSLAKNYAHRGFHNKPNIPENSLSAFRRAISHGFSSELDVHLTADDKLVVFHDSSLERMTGADGVIEDFNLEALKKLRLEGTAETIPTFDEVLTLYEDTGLSLLIELKTGGGNFKKLAKAVCERLDSYRGDFVIESFDPRILIAVKRLRPEIVRGQLSQNFLKNRESLPFYQAFLLTHLAFNVLAKPDFIAYRFEDRFDKPLRHFVDKKGLLEAFWTIKTHEDYNEAVKAGSIPIFENFDPDEL